MVTNETPPQWFEDQKKHGTPEDEDLKFKRKDIPSWEYYWKFFHMPVKRFWQLYWDLLGMGDPDPVLTIRQLYGDLSDDLSTSEYT